MCTKHKFPDYEISRLYKTIPELDTQVCKHRLRRRRLYAKAECLKRRATSLLSSSLAPLKYVYLRPTQLQHQYLYTRPNWMTVTHESEECGRIPWWPLEGDMSTFCVEITEEANVKL
jgi:hypothetical protein